MQRKRSIVSTVRSNITTIGTFPPHIKECKGVLYFNRRTAGNQTKLLIGPGSDINLLGDLFCEHHQIKTRDSRKLTKSPIGQIVCSKK